MPVDLAPPEEPRTVRVRFHLPDVLAALPEAERPDRVVGAEDGQLLLVEGVGGFVRAVLPVRTTRATLVDFVVWVAVEGDDLERARSAWGTPAYAALTFAGTLANTPKPWGQRLHGARLTATVQDPRLLPVVAASEHPLLSDLLTEVWGRDLVLGPVPAPLPVTVRAPLPGRWSIERTAGLAARPARQGLQLVSPGRTVWAATFEAPSQRPAELVEGLLTREGPSDVEPVRERAGDLWRGARLHTARDKDGREGQVLSGYVAHGGGWLQVACTFTDAADKAWALSVWRSARRDARPA